MVFGRAARVTETPVSIGGVLRESGEPIGNCGIRRQLGNDWGANIAYEIAPEHSRPSRTLP